MLVFNKNILKGSYFFHLKEQNNKLMLHFNNLRVLNENNTNLITFIFSKDKLSNVSHLIENLVNEKKDLKGKDLENEFVKIDQGLDQKEIRDLTQKLKLIFTKFKENKEFKLDNKDKKSIEKKSPKLLEVIPMILKKIISSKVDLKRFVRFLGKEITVKLPKEVSSGEIDELVNDDGTFINSSVPLLNLWLHPRYTQDMTVAMTRQTTNPIVRGYRVYYGESKNLEKSLIKEVDYTGSYAWEDVQDAKTYKEADKILQDVNGIKNEKNRDERLDIFGFDPELDAELEDEKRHGFCKKCFTKRRLSELEKNKMESIIDEILLDKKKSNKDVMKKNTESSSNPVEKILVKNLESIKKLADKEDLDFNSLLKKIKTDE